MPSLQLYANLVSQPSRAVAWLLKIQNVDYELIQVDFGGPIATSEAFLQLNPSGFVPVLVDDDFALFEGNAILTYLADKFNWDDWYPRNNVRARAKINEYLHWHHTTVRTFTTKVLRPLVRQQLGVASPEELAFVSQISETIETHTAIVEKLLVKDYVGRTDAPSVADLALYCEYDQLEAIGLLDLTKFPKTEAWLQRMKHVPFHDEIRVAMHGFLTGVGLEQTTDVKRKSVGDAGTYIDAAAP